MTARKQVGEKLEHGDVAAVTVDYHYAGETQKIHEKEKSEVALHRQPSGGKPSLGFIR